jgi:photosystem II stability/assembly factor-like uncharacterized protein
MDTLAGMLVDVYFTSLDTGFVVGGTGDLSRGNPIILGTTNGGLTWTKKTQININVNVQFCWKICHPSRNVFYVTVHDDGGSLQDTLYLLKSMDGGTTWTEHGVPSVQPGQGEGIGFLNDNVGWIGSVQSGYSYTTDGGNTFTYLDNPPTLNYMNRIQFINDTIGYAVGIRVYKFCPSCNIAGIKNLINNSGYKLEQNMPNPYRGVTNITYSIPDRIMVNLSILDGTGRLVSTLVNKIQEAGTYTVPFYSPIYGKQGISDYFYCDFRAGTYTNVIKLISIN